MSAAQLLSGCGSDGVDPVQDDFAEQAIVGGAPAKVGMFPGIVSLRKPGDIPWCGGTLIAPHWVLTAAHCMAPGFRAGFQDVVAGNNLVVSSKTGEHVDVWRAYMHPEYNDTTHAQDYALFRLKIDAKEPPARLATASELSALPAKAELWVAGWGDTEEDAGLGSDVLLYTTIPLIDRTACLKEYPDLGTETICAGAAEGGRDSCQGDSGGPLFAEVGGKQVQVGVVSSGLGCARPNTAGLYAGVPSASSWITATIAQGESDFAKLGACVASCDKASACTDAEDPVTCTLRNETCLCTCAGETTGLCDLTALTAVSPELDGTTDAPSTGEDDVDEDTTESTATTGEDLVDDKDSPDDDDIGADEDEDFGTEYLRTK